MIALPTPAADWLLVLPVVLPLLGAALLVMVRNARAFQAGFAMLVVIAVLACEGSLFARVLETGPVSMTMGRWLPPFGISFTADLAGVGLAFTAAALTLVILLFAQSGNEGRDGRTAFAPLVLLLLAGVTGSFLTGDLFNLYVWFEVMLIASFGLLVYGARTIQLDAAVKYAFPNFLATTLFLTALGLLYGLLGTLNMADIARVAPAADKVAISAIAALLGVAFAMKAAAFPLNGWLPASYHAPPPVISALLAGLLTKVGAYALLRTLAALLPASRDLLEPVLAIVAILTLVIAPMGAIAETNLRRAIGFMLIGGIGAIIAGLALDTEAGLAGASLYIFHAMLTITALYLVAGCVEWITGETDSRRMGGVYGARSGISILFLAMVLSVAGVPPLLGFWPKLLLLQAGVTRGWGAAGADVLSLALVAGLLVNSILTLIAGSRLWAHIFWRSGPEGPLSEAANPRLAIAPVRNAAAATVAVWALGIVVLLAGLLPQGLVSASATIGADLLDPSRYIESVGLAEAEP